MTGQAIVKPAAWVAGFIPHLLALCLLFVAWHLKHPLMYWLRYAETPLLLALASAGLLWRRGFAGRLLAALLFAVIIVTLYREAEFQYQRTAVLNGGDSMRTVGAHFIVGFTDFAELQPMAARGLIGGIYLTRRNLRGRTLADVAADIDALQSIRRRAELPPLIVASDQEGGPVSHLSPWLEAMPPLASVIGTGDPTQAAHDYGARQGAGLAALGVNLNFGPVVDLRPTAGDFPDNGLTRISTRAISADPDAVSAVAAGYIDGLGEHGVRATLKHFPGLGRVRQDTHFRSACLEQPAAALAGDWQPFQQLSGRSGTAIMLGHVILSSIDPERATSHSSAVVDGLLRTHWGYDGVLITDDLNMGAVYDLGIGQVATEALAAGVDLVLVSYDPRQIYQALYETAMALERGEMAYSRLQQSAQRLAEFIAPPESRVLAGTNAKIAAPAPLTRPDAPADSRIAAGKPAFAG